MEKKNRKLGFGFTLVELLIVLAVIAILVAIIIPSFRGMQKEAWFTEAQKEVATLQAAVESYYKHHANIYTTALSQLWATATEPKLVMANPGDPFNTDAAGGYGYLSGTDTEFGAYYIIYSKGPDLTAGTSWDATNNTADITGDDTGVSNAPVSAS